MPVIKAARNADEIRETLMDRTALSTLVKNPDAFVEWTKSTIANMNEGVAEQVSELAEATAIDMIRNGALKGEFEAKRLNLDPDSSVRKNQLRSFAGVNPNFYNKNAPGADLDSLPEFKDLPIGTLFGDMYLHAADRLEVAGRRRMNKLIEVSNAMSSLKPADGGFLIPEQMRADILTLTMENAIVRPRATVMPMTSLMLDVPTIDETSRATSVFGGIVFGWAAESEQLQVTQPRFGKAMLRAQKAYWYTHIPNELYDDAPALTTWLARRLPGAVGFNEDRYFIKGNGTGEPLGVLNAPGRVNVNRAVGNQIAYADVVNMYARMLPASLGNAVWIASNSTIPQLFNMTVTVGTGGSLVFIINAADPGPLKLFGRPIIFTEHASALGTPGDLAFVDFGEYLLGDRMAMQVKTSADYRFQNDEIALRMIERVDGRPWLAQPITPENGGATLSPYVVLN